MDDFNLIGMEPVVFDCDFQCERPDREEAYNPPRSSIVVRRERTFNILEEWERQPGMYNGGQSLLLCLASD